MRRTRETDDSCNGSLGEGSTKVAEERKEARKKKGGVKNTGRREANRGRKV